MNGKMEDGWMKGWMTEWEDGWKEGWEDGWMDCQINGWLSVAASGLLLA